MCKYICVSVEGERFCVVKCVCIREGVGELECEVCVHVEGFPIITLKHYHRREREEEKR